MLCLGCGSAFIVHKNGSELKGIPFYVKEASCLHQRIYTMPYYKLTLQSLVGDKVAGAETFTVSERFYTQETKVKELLSVMRQKPPLTANDLNTMNSDWDVVKNNNADPYSAAATDTWPKYLVTNSNSPKVYVDYGSVYTLNAKRPVSGSVTANYKIAADGTLSEASSQISDDTLKTVLGSLPISSLISTAAGIGAAPSSTGKPTTTETPIQLLVERRALKITNSQLIPFVAGCPDVDAFDTAHVVGLSIEDVSSDATNSNAKTDDNSISVSGKITLPKAKAATPSAPSAPATGNSNTGSKPPVQPNSDQ
jgi:hypothetical protein